MYNEKYLIPTAVYTIFSRVINEIEDENNIPISKNTSEDELREIKKTKATIYKFLQFLDVKSKEDILGMFDKVYFKINK